MDEGRNRFKMRSVLDAMDAAVIYGPRPSGWMHPPPRIHHVEIFPTEEKKIIIT